jgi:cation diffusion facilitator family transporter
LYKVSHTADSLALEADARHLSADVYTSLGVLVGLVIIRLTGLVILDPIIAIGVALFIMWTAYTMTRKSFGGLVDTTLPPAEEELIMNCITEHGKDVVGFHELRTRKAGSHRYVDLHLVMARNATVEEAHSMCDHLEQDIAARLPKTSVFIHCEPCETEHCTGCEVSCGLRQSKE